MRPLKRFLQRHLKTRLARRFFASEGEEGAKVTFKMKDEGLVIA